MSRLAFLLCLCVAAVVPPALSGCDRKARARPGNSGDLRFVDAAREAGIDFVHSNGAAHPLDILQTTGSGLAWLDYDQDGHVDLYCVRGTPSGDTGDALYRNRGDGTFEDVTARAGIRPGGYGMGCAAGDYDGNGYPDLYVTRYGVNALYRNRGDGRFEEVAEAAGVAGKPIHGTPKWSLGAAWFDADGDRDLDLYVTNYLAFGEHEKRFCNSNGVLANCSPLHYAPQPDLFYRNRGDGTFQLATREFGFEMAKPARGMAVLPFHPEPGRPPALYVANDTTANFLFVRTGAGQYVETAHDSGCALSESGEDTASMGVDSADVDGDGLPELAVGTFQHEENSLYRNLGSRNFVEVSHQVGLGVSTWNSLAFGCGFLDADLDGDPDLVFANGHVWDNAAQVDRSATYAQRPQFFRNHDGIFQDLSSQAGPVFQEARVGRGMAFADYDNDGDVDVAVSCSGSAVQLWRNDSPRRHHWLQLRLVGGRPSREALGAVVTLSAGGQTQVSEVRGGRGYLSDSERRLTFGLGAASRVDRITVRWPDGSEQTLRDVGVDTLLTVDQTQPARKQPTGTRPRSEGKRI